MRRGVQALLNDAERAGGELDVLWRLRRIWPQNDGRLALAARLLNGLDHVRLDELAAVRDHRVEARQLEGGDEDVALADGELDGVAARPDLVDLGLEIAPPPFGSWHQADLFRAEVD